MAWTKEDRSAWKNSEVFSQFEKNIIDNLQKLSSGNYLLKNSQDKTQKLKETTQAVAGLNQQLSQMEQKIKSLNLSDDGYERKKQEDELMFHQDNPRAEIFHTEDLESSNSDDDYIKDQILDDLKSMAEEAVSTGNIKLAYQIERTIQEIMDES